MTYKTAGQPQTHPFEKIKTKFWFLSVRSQVKKEVLEECQEEIIELERKVEAGTILDKKRLRTLKNRLARITGKGNYKNSEIKYSDIQNHLENKENQIAPDKLTTADGIGKLSSKVWGRYGKGTYTPARILDDLCLVYPDSKSWYVHGPYSIFITFESNTFIEALETTKNALFSALKEPLKIKIDEKDSLFMTDWIKDTKQAHESAQKEIISRFKVLCDSHENSRQPKFKEFESILELFLDLQQPIEPMYLYEDIQDEHILLNLEEHERFEFNYRINFKAIFKQFKGLNEEAAACLYLSFAYIAYKFLGDSSYLSKAINIYSVLSTIGDFYEIDEEHWFINNERNPSPVTAVFINIRKDVLFKHYQNRLEIEKELLSKIIAAKNHDELECGWNITKSDSTWVKISENKFRSDFRYSL